MSEPDKVTLGGNEYSYIGINGTLARDLFVMTHVRHAGLAGAEMLEGESPEEYAARLLDLLLTSGKALLILGGMIVPVGSDPRDWTSDMARATATDLGAITDPDQKRKVQQELLSVVIAFFANGLGSWIASERASGQAEAEKTSPEGDGANGTESSGWSETTILTAASGSSDG